jgi:hypothetical protein
MVCSSRSQTETLVTALETYLVLRPSLPRVLPAGSMRCHARDASSDTRGFSYPGGLSGLEPPRHVWPGVTMLGFSSP